MVRQVLCRQVQARWRLLSGCVLGAALALILGVLPISGPLAAAGPIQAHAAGPTAITVDGPGLSKTLVVRATEHPDQFSTLLDEVGWLYSGSGQSAEPTADQLGAKFTVTVYSGQAPTQQYEVYPLASGGPRAFRPASQPNGRQTGAAWFYARLSMPDSMRSAGVPIDGGALNVLNGGIGGGGSAATDPSPSQGTTLHSLVGQWRQFVLLNGAVVVVITIGLAGISLLIRRAERRRLRRVRR
jgi:hypothetical protein